MKRVAIAVFLCLAANTQAARFLFDAGHAQTAGSADWVIDADLRNITWNNTGTFTVTGANHDSNAQRIPTLAASGITSSTTETYWDGALSAWAVDLVKRGHSVETLPAGLRFTYNTVNTQDLINYDVVVIDEPNIVFTLAEKQALLSFVTNGGSLFMICDHAGSDRDNNGCDSVCVWNDFLTNNGLTNNPFGIVFNTNSTFPSAGNASGTNTFSHSIIGNPILNGPIGLATNIAYFNGNEFQIDNTKNPTTISHMWFGAASDSNNLCALASLQYGKGRVVVCGDSSPIEDGTGDPGDSLFNGYTGDMGGIQHIWIMNSSEWLAAPFAPVANPTNSWTSGSGGKWETGANWVNGTPSSTDAANLITNATTKNVTIDAPTTNTASSLTISNLTVSGPPGTVNTLQITNAGVAIPLIVLNTATLGNGGAILVTNSAMRIAASLLAQGTLTVQNGGTLALAGPMQIGSGTVLVTGGQLVITNVPSNVGVSTGLVVDGSISLTNGSSVNVTNVDAVFGNRGSGTLTNFGGSALFANLIFGNFGGAHGTLTALGGTISSSGTLSLGKSAGATGALWLKGGSLYVTNGVFPGNMVVGAVGQGTFALSNGTAQVDQAYVGHGVGGSGTMTIAGGSYLAPNALTIGDFVSGVGTVWITGGTLKLTNNIATANIFTHDGLAQLTVSNGTLTVDVALLSSLSLVGHGTLTFVGGTSTINTNIVLGNYGCGSGQGNVVVAGGSLFVTNASHTAVLEVRNGMLELDSGTLTVDKLVMTNACANFVRTGGTLTYSNVVLDPNADTDGDGIPNGYELAHGLDPLNPADAALDNDHDGFSNLLEYQAGTDPNDPTSSPFRVTDAHFEGGDIRVTWVIGPGSTNVLQATSGGPGGSYDTNSFATIFAVTNAIGPTTNYLDVGAGTNFPARYYRVRLLP